MLPVTVSSDQNPTALRVWLALIAAMIALTAIVGAATRLTGSGLSITEWAPIIGVIPPLGEADWLAAFEKYQAIPQYAQVNKGMRLDAFKTIFWWEWGHRLLARSIGVLVAVPALAFVARGMIPQGLGRKLAGLFALGALQGAAGWYMVRSGLVDRVDVSQYRLALHFGLAVALLGATLWLFLGLDPDRERRHFATITRRQAWTACTLAALGYLQTLLGALVAGLKAGRTYNTWPLMDGALVPDGLARMEPGWRNLFENPATVQFNHRLLAYGLVALAVAHAVSIIRSADDERVRVSAGLLAVVMLAQAALGVWTLLAWVPVHLGIAHQAGAMTVFAVAIWHLYAVRRASQT